MNYSEILNSIKQASLFDLYRLNVAIQNELENPQRILKLRDTFKAGDKLSYFDAKHNCLRQGIVLHKNPKYVLIQDEQEGSHWRIPYYLLNLQNIAVDIQASASEKLSKNNLKLGDGVGFNKDGELIVGKIIRLNFKTVTLLTPHHQRWRVGYSFLFRYVDAEFEKAFNQELLNLAIKEP